MPGRSRPGRLLLGRAEEKVKRLHSSAHFQRDLERSAHLEAHRPPILLTGNLAGSRTHPRALRRAALGHAHFHPRGQVRLRQSGDGKISHASVQYLHGLTIDSQGVDERTREGTGMLIGSHVGRSVPPRRLPRSSPIRRSGNTNPRPGNHPPPRHPQQRPIT